MKIFMKIVINLLVLSFFAVGFIYYQAGNEQLYFLLKETLFSGSESAFALLETTEFASISSSDMTKAIPMLLGVTLAFSVGAVIFLNILWLRFKKTDSHTKFMRFVKDDLCGLFPNINKKIGFALALIPFVLFIGAYMGYSNYKTEINPKQKIFPLVSSIGTKFVENATTADKRVDRIAYKNVKAMDLAIIELEKSGKDSIEVELNIDRKTTETKTMSLIELKIDRTLTSIKASKAFSDTSASLSRLFVAMVISSSIALIIALYMGMFQSIEVTLSGFLTFFGAIQPVAILPILMIVAGVEDFGKIVFIVTVLTTTLVLATFREVKGVPKQNIIKGLTMGASTFKVIYKVVLPKILPRFIDIIRGNLYLGWIFLLTSEMISAESGLGYRIMLFKRSTAMDNIIGYVILITVLSLTIDFLLRSLNKRLFPWYSISK